MANTDWPAGLRPISNAAGTAPRVTLYTRSTTGAIGEGALVHMAQTGPACVAQTTADGDVIGATAHYVGASDTALYVFDDPNQEYLIQGDSAVTTPRSILGFYCNPLNATTFNSTTLQSAMELDTSEATSTAAAGDILQIVRLWSGVDNEQALANAKWIVKVPERSHLFTSGRTLTT